MIFLKEEIYQFRKQKLRYWKLGRHMKYNLPTAVRIELKHIMIILVAGCYLLFGMEKFWPAYENVHRFVFDKVIDHEVGEWRPLLTRSGEPLWTHMSHSWKINYHSVRAMVQSINRMDKLLEKI